MKQRILLLLMICSLLHSEAQQNTIYSSSSEWQEVKVGDTMPDIPLGVVTNNVTGKKRFSDFKGKLVILDFWNTGCSSCMAGFPHMSELQEKYKDKIQIFLVNDVQTQEEIDKDLGHSYKKKYLPPANLPSIVSGKHGDNILNQLFPSKGGPGYHVWIDGNGVVRLRGMGEINTYEEKIEDLLAGKPISYASDEGGKYDGLLPLYLGLSKMESPAVLFDSLVTKFAGEIAPYYGFSVKNYRDSASGTIRNSFLNYTIQNLYLAAVETNELRKEWGTVLNPQVTRFTVPILAKDKSRYSDQYLSEPKTDQWLRANAFSYEIITPFSTSDRLIRAYMLEDLNRYFGHLYRTEGNLQKRKVACWQIVRTPGKNKMLALSDADRVNIKELKEKGKAFIQYEYIELNEVLRNIVAYNNDLQNSIPFIDATEFEGRVDIKVPKEINSIEGLRAALALYGLDVVKGEKEMSVLVIQEKGVEE